MVCLVQMFLPFKMDEELLILMCEEGDISDEELEDLMHIQRSETVPLPVRQNFDLSQMTEEECHKNFRFLSGDLHDLCRALRCPEDFFADNRCKISGIDGLCLLLRRLAYPARLHDLEYLFGRDMTVLSRLFNVVLDHVFDNFDHVLGRVNPQWITQAALVDWADAVVEKGSPFETCVGYIDGTNMEICRPTDYATQRMCYSGYTREHDLKYFGIMLPNGIMLGVHGPYPGSFHDSRMLYESELQNSLAANLLWNPPNRLPYHIYGDQAYRSTPQVMAPFRTNPTPVQLECNRLMSSLRISVEWGFGKISQLFAFTEFAENQKLGLQPLGKYYRVTVLLANCHSCVYGSNVTSYFDVDSPSLETYLAG